MREKSMTFNLTKDEYVAFNTVCSERGYSKTGKLRELIRNLVKIEIGAVKASAAEWDEIKEGIKEIEGGKFTTLEELRRGLEKRKMESCSSK